MNPTPVIHTETTTIHDRHGNLITVTKQIQQYTDVYGNPVGNSMIVGEPLYTYENGASVPESAFKSAHAGSSSEDYDNFLNSYVCLDKASDSGSDTEWQTGGIPPTQETALNNLNNTGDSTNSDDGPDCWLDDETPGTATGEPPLASKGTDDGTTLDDMYGQGDTQASGNDTTYNPAAETQPIIPNSDNVSSEGFTPSPAESGTGTDGGTEWQNGGIPPTQETALEQVNGGVEGADGGTTIDQMYAENNGVTPSNISAAFNGAADELLTYAEKKGYDEFGNPIAKPTPDTPLVGEPTTPVPDMAADANIAVFEGRKKGYDENGDPIYPPNHPNYRQNEEPTTYVDRRKGSDETLGTSKTECVRAGIADKQPGIPSARYREKYGSGVEKDDLTAKGAKGDLETDTDKSPVCITVDTTAVTDASNQMNKVAQCLEDGTAELTFARVKLRDCICCKGSEILLGACDKLKDNVAVVSADTAHITKGLLAVVDKANETKQACENGTYIAEV